MHYAGLDISDDAVRCIEFNSGKVSKFGYMEIPTGTIEGGDIKDEKVLSDLLREFDKKNNLSYVKVSVPEEKAYLFQTDITGENTASIAQNIEFKLEENVPIPASEAVFYYDPLPMSVTGGVRRASVSVIPRTYIEKYMNVLRGSGIFPLSFEVVPKAIANACTEHGSDHAELLVHIMKFKTGVYIVAGGVVCFTSTLGWGNMTDKPESGDNYVSALQKEINRVHDYWMTREMTHSSIESIILLGHDAPNYEMALAGTVIDGTVPVRIAETWKNSLNLDKYIPPISRDDSLDYVVAAGLALPR